jgi:hypothetical protein
MFGHDVRRNKLRDGKGTQSHDYQVIAIAQDRDKVRYQVDRAQEISGNKKS